MEEKSMYQDLQPIKVDEALLDEKWIQAMQEESKLHSEPSGRIKVVENNNVQSNVNLLHTLIKMKKDAKLKAVCAVTTNIAPKQIWIKL